MQRDFHEKCLPSLMHLFNYNYTIIIKYVYQAKKKKRKLIGWLSSTNRPYFENQEKSFYCTK